MEKAKTRGHILALVESSLLVALGFVLSYVTLFEMPQGGSVTPLSMLPILMIGMRRGLKWGLAGGFVFACLQMLQKFWPPPTGTFLAYAAVVVLDYIAAFGVLGLSGFFKGRKYGLLYAIPLCMALRFLFHFASGLAIWHEYAGEMPVWVYSLTYNGSYMVVEMAMTLVVGAVLCKTAPILFRTQTPERN
ncbi:MAG: energy-coupled thiamine transporter ThiT [Oscillospiraceae bacterium]|jgi:thiamine transporter|nr:energy-coupled thiamine transporter ThiT [Oscillospiraceae bacterium]